MFFGRTEVGDAGKGFGIACHPGFGRALAIRRKARGDAFGGSAVGDTVLVHADHAIGTIGGIRPSNAQFTN